MGSGLRVAVSECRWVGSSVLDAPRPEIALQEWVDPPTSPRGGLCSGRLNNFSKFTEFFTWGQRWDMTPD